MRPVIQTEASECGLACIAMVSSHYGSKQSLRELRVKFAISLKGASLGRLIGIARQLGYQTRALRLDLHELSQLTAPCILHWDLNHFVVLEKVSRKGVTILDPAVGRQVLSTDEVSKHFTGVALELTPEVDFKAQKKSPSISIRQLTGRVDGIWRSLALILLLSIALQVFVILSPFYMQWTVDHALVTADRSLLTVLGLGFGLAVIIQIAIGLARGWAVVYLSSRLGLQWMGNVFRHLLRLPMDFFEKRHLGDVVSRMSAVQAIQHTLTTNFVEALIDGLMAVVTLVMMLFYSAKLSLISLAAVGLYLCIRLIAFRPLRDGTEQQLIAGAKQQSHLLETIRGTQSIKLSGTEAIRESSYQNLMYETVSREIRIAHLGLGFNSLSQLVFGLERIAVIWIGALLAMDSVFSVGMLIAFLAYKEQFTARVGSLIDKGIEFRMLRLHGERLSDIVLTSPENDDCSLPEHVAPDESSLAVRDVSFRYAEGEPYILQNCSFDVRDGESVAIVGPSGSGKTTLGKLLLGLLKPSSGSISFGGQEINALGLRTYRHQIGAVMQDDQLFAGSIAENIAFGEEVVDMARVEEAAMLASIHDEIASMPMGYHSLIGDMGTTLSGGQKQRVILARALYRRPRLLLLDEATSHLDVERERLVNDAVRQLNVTKIIIAHRPETIASADRILILASGQIHEIPRDSAAISHSTGSIADEATNE